MRPRRIAVVDGTATRFGVTVAQALRGVMRDTVTRSRPRYQVAYVAAAGRLDAARDSLIARTGLRAAGDTGLDGVLVVDDSVLTAGRVRYFGANVSSPGDMAALNRVLRPLVVLARLQRAGVDPGVAFTAAAPPDLVTEKVAGGKLTGESGGASFALAYAMSFILYFALLLYGIQVMSAVVEEKSSRIMEVLVSTLSPFQMMMGKVLGVAATALAQLAIWGGTAMVITNYRGQLAHFFGASEASVANFSIPTVSPALFAVFLVFFGLGFIFYSALYAGIGSFCNTHQDAQQSQVPVTICILMGLFLMFSVLGDPNGALARKLSLVPFFAPFVTPVRFSIAPPGWLEMTASVLAMVIGVVAAVWVAGRIYRVGILMYGKKPRLSEVARWIRAA